MKKLLFILLLFCLTTLAFGQWSGRKPMLGEQINKAHQLGDPVGAWFFNEDSGPKVFDLSGNGYTGTITGAIWTPAKTGSGLKFDLDTEYVDIGDKSAFEGISAITIAALVQPVTSDSDGAVVDKYWDGDDRGWLLYLEFPGPKWRWLVATDTQNSNLEVYSASTPVNNQWYYVVGTWSATSGKVKIYVNGVFEAEAAATGNTLRTNTVPVHFGNAYYDGSNSRTLDGIIDHVLIWDKELSTSEIALLYREPFCMFEEDLPVAMMYDYAPSGVSIPVFMYHYMNHGYIFLPVIPFGLYYLWRRKCAA